MPERILIADDDDAILLLLSKALEFAGYTVETAGDGLAALECLRARPGFAVLLTDLMMPKMGGLELIGHARQLDSLLEIIVITAAGSLETAIAAMRDGDAWDYLTKPFESIDQLKVVVSRAIDHRRLLKARRDEEERLRALVANIGDALLAVSDDGRVAIANPAAQRLLGRSDLQGQPVDEVLPTRLAQVLRNWQRMGRPHPASMELSWSGERQVLVTLTPLPGEGWVMALSDITHLKQAEMLKNQAMAEMLARLRLPMASAMSAIIDLNASTGPDHPLADKLFRLTDIWEKMQAWGDELAAMVQGDASHTLSAALVNVYQALQKTLQSKAVKAFQRSGVGLNLDCDDASPNLYTDPDLFQQLLSNLVARAMQRTPPGQAVNLRLRTEDQQVWLEVCDAGPENDPSIPDIELAHARSLVARLDGQLWSAGVCRESSLTVCFPAA